jgi:hypothetical protein
VQTIFANYRCWGSSSPPHFLFTTCPSKPKAASWLSEPLSVGFNQARPISHFSRCLHFAAALCVGCPFSCCPKKGWLNKAGALSQRWKKASLARGTVEIYLYSSRLRLTTELYCVVTSVVARPMTQSLRRHSRTGVEHSILELRCETLGINARRTHASTCKPQSLAPLLGGRQALVIVGSNLLGLLPRRLNAAHTAISFL